MKYWFYWFLCGVGTYFFFNAIGKLIDKSGITLDDFVSCLLKIRDSVPIIVFILPVVCLAIKCIDNIMQ